MPLPAFGEPHLLSGVEWDVVETFFGHPVTDRHGGASAFWEQTYANDHGLPANFIRWAWLGDRVLNLALADRLEHGGAPTRSWGATDAQLIVQSRYAAAQVVASWPAEVQGLLRVGNTWRRRQVPHSVWSSYAEALVGVLFREHGYLAARDLVWRWWPVG